MCCITFDIVSKRVMTKERSYDRNKKITEKLGVFYIHFCKGIKTLRNVIVQVKLIFQSIFPLEIFSLVVNLDVLCDCRTRNEACPGLPDILEMCK